jgi:hypothetical protein
MAKYIVDEAILYELSEKFDQARALFDVIEDEIEHEPRTYLLATIGMGITHDGALAVGKLLDGEKVQPAQDREVTHG